MDGRSTFSSEKADCMASAAIMTWEIDFSDTVSVADLRHGSGEALLDDTVGAHLFLNGIVHEAGRFFFLSVPDGIPDLFEDRFI